MHNLLQYHVVVNGSLWYACLAIITIINDGDDEEITFIYFSFFLSFFEFYSDFLELFQYKKKQKNEIKDKQKQNMAAARQKQTSLRLLHLRGSQAIKLSFKMFGNKKIAYEKQKFIIFFLFTKTNFICKFNYKAKHKNHFSLFRILFIA